MTDTVDIFIRDDCSVLLSQGDKRMEFVLSPSDAVRMGDHLMRVAHKNIKQTHPKGEGFRYGS